MITFFLTLNVWSSIMNRFLFLFLSFSICFQLSAQPKKPVSLSKEAQKMEDQANEYFEKQNYILAQELYEKLDSISPRNNKYIYPLALCYINNDLSKKALPYIDQCLKKSSSFPVALFYFAGMTYHLNNRFDDAIRYYDRYRTFVKKSTDKNSKTVVDNMTRQIQMCNNGKELVKKRLSLEVFNISRSVNSKYPDYRPVVSLDEGEIIFTSNRPNTTGGLKNDEGIYFEDIYISYRNDTGWTKPVQMGNGINTAGHDAAVSLSPSGTKLIIYRFGKEKFMSAASGDLYLSELKDGKWSKAVRMGDNINSPGWEPSACFTQDENTLYFASNREGGIGGTDLYVAKKLADGTWALPKNLGNVINTDGDEDSPFIQPDGKTLYFSSSGHKSMGGYDVFVTHYDDDKKTWSSPENVGYPINTAHDDLYFSWSQDGKRVYFSSARPGGMGDKDLYYAVIHAEMAGTLIMKGIVQDSLSSEPLETKIKVTDKNNQMIGVYNSDKAGKYLITLTEGKDYKISIEVPGYKPYLYTTNLTELQELGELDKDIRLVKSK
jgi:tetratricopeptide (TPR) repeat protein